MVILGKIIDNYKVERTGKYAELQYNQENWENSLWPKFPIGAAGHVISRKAAEYIVENLSTLIDYQGEDVSLGIWMDEFQKLNQNLIQKSKVIMLNDERFRNDGDCFADKNAFIVGHRLTQEDLEDCYKFDNTEHLTQLLKTESSQLDLSASSVDLADVIGESVGTLTEKLEQLQKLHQENSQILNEQQQQSHPVHDWNHSQLIHNRIANRKVLSKLKSSDKSKTYKKSMDNEWSYIFEAINQEHNQKLASKNNHSKKNLNGELDVDGFNNSITRNILSSLENRHSHNSNDTNERGSNSSSNFSNTGKMKRKNFMPSFIPVHQAKNYRNAAFNNHDRVLL